MTSVSDPDLDWIRIQGSSGSGFGIRIRGLKKRSKNKNNQNIILLFSDFYNILSFDRLLLMIETYNNEVLRTQEIPVKLVEKSAKHV